MAYALDREVDDGIADRFGPRAIGRDVTGVVRREQLRVHLVREGQDDASGEFVVGYHIAVFPDNIEAEFLTKNEKKKAKLQQSRYIRRYQLMRPAVSSYGTLSVLRRSSLMKEPLELLMHNTFAFRRCTGRCESKTPPQN